MRWTIEVVVEALIALLPRVDRVTAATWSVATAKAAIADFFFQTNSAQPAGQRITAAAAPRAVSRKVGFCFPFFSAPRRRGQPYAAPHPLCTSDMPRVSDLRHEVNVTVRLVWEEQRRADVC